MSDTPTPRTDAEASDGWSGDAVCVSAEFARQLERELAAVTKERDDALAMLGCYAMDKSDLNARIKRLEKAFAELEECDFNPDNCASLEIASARIRSFAKQAKEAR